MTDILNRIRQLLGIDKSKKRKAPEDSTLTNSISKRSRLSNNHFLERPTNDDDFYPSTRIDQISANRRRTIDSQMSNQKFSDLYSKQNEHEQHQYHLQQQQRHQQHRLLLHTQRQVPDLVKANYLMTNGGTHLIRKEIPSMVPINSDRFSKIPALYPIQRPHQPTTSNYLNGPLATMAAYSPYTPMVSTSHPFSGESMPNGRCVTDNHIISNAYPSGPSLRSSAQPFLNNVATARDLHPTKTTNTSRLIANHVTKAADKEQKALFSSLLSRINPFSKPKAKLDVDPRTNQSHSIEIVDLATDTDVSKASIYSNTSSLSSVEPVNSLRLKYGHRAIVQDGWQSDLNQHYQTLKQNHAELAQKERDKTNEAESLSKELEEKICNKLKLVELEPPSFVYEIKEEEEESNDFPELSDDQLHKIQQIIYGRERDSGQPLITRFSISISRRDVQTLGWDPLQWLNDEVINFYMELLAERSKQCENLPKVYSMNTFFLKRLLETGYSAVRRWTRKVDIFSYDIVPIPVHKNIHWCMAIIHFKNKTIRYYDSMGAPDNLVLNSLEEYLEAESLDKRKVPFDKSGWTKENMQGIPQQENGSDCGVFSCMFAEFVARNRPIAFSQQHMQYFRMRMVYEICSGKLLV